MPKPFSSDDYIPSFGADCDVMSISKGKTAPLYVCRKVVNTAEIIAWAKSQGFKSVIAPEELHVTVIYSKSPVDWFKMGQNWWNEDKNGEITIQPGGPRAVERLGDKGAVVLMFASNDLSFRNRSAIEEYGASWDYAEYQPHITITYDAGDLEIDDLEPYRGKIVLGPEIFEEIEDDWEMSIVEKVDCRIAKVDESLGLVFGWAIVTHVDGQPYYDWNIDKSGERVPEHITQDAMLKASVDFALGQRVGNDMHKGADKGVYPFVFPMTDEIAKAYGITCDKRGLMTAFKPPADILAKYKSGEYTGFSIEGGRVVYEESEND